MQVNRLQSFKPPGQPIKLSDKQSEPPQDPQDQVTLGERCLLGGIVTGLISQRPEKGFAVFFGSLAAAPALSKTPDTTIPADPSYDSYR